MIEGYTYLLCCGYPAIDVGDNLRAVTVLRSKVTALRQTVDWEKVVHEVYADGW